MKASMRSVLQFYLLASFLPSHSLYAQAVEANVRIHPSAISQTEVSIVAHPADPNIVLIGSNVTTSTSFSIGWYYSSQAGANWVGADSAPASAGFEWRNDPAVAIDLDGNLFYASNGGPFPFPSGQGTKIVLARSTDNGSSWNQTIVSDTNRVFPHKPHLAVDVGSSSPYRNNVYVAYTDLSNLSNPFAYNWPIYFSRSTDRGKSFSVPIAINNGLAAYSHIVNIAVGPAGELYATWLWLNNWASATQGKIGFNSSYDGGKSWSQAGLVANNSGFDFFLSKGGNQIIGIPWPSMAVDRSNSPRRGWVYIVYVDHSSTVTPDIFLLRSTDSGGTWSSAKRVNQDTTSNDQWHPWITVDPATGALYVAYFDSRNFSANDSAEVYVSASYDGGESFNDVRVSDVPFLPKVAPAPAENNYSGEYIGISALRDTVWTCWYDNRSGTYQVYVSKILYNFPLTGIFDSRIKKFPAEYDVEQNYPNPFNPTTVISYQIAVSRHVTVKMFDILGREVATLVNEEKPPGSYSVQWNAPNMPSGVYFYRLTAGSFSQAKKLLLIK